MADHSESEGEEDNLIHRAIESSVAPFRFLTSRSALKAYLSTFLFILASTILVTISTTAYFFFYYKYIPPINLQKNIHLQYGPGMCPAAVTSLENTALIAQQPYDVEIKLVMPRTPTNLIAGNFMVDLQLLGPYNPLAQGPKSISALVGNITMPKTEGLSILHHSRRPAMLPYASPIPFLAQNLLFLPLHLLNLRDLDSSCLRIPMFELLSFPRGAANIPTHIRLEIKSDSSINTGSAHPIFNIPFLGSASVPNPGDLKTRSLQIYSSKISFCARFQGLRYIVYNYRTLSFLIFTMLFYTSSVLSMLLAWMAISTLLNRDSQWGSLIKREPAEGRVQDKGRWKAEGEEPRIKAEEEQDGSTSGGLSPSNLSDTPATFPTGPRKPPLQYPGRPQMSASASVAQQRLRLGEVADDEEGEENQAMMERAWDRGREGDSGIGTSLESEGPGIMRRRSGRGSSSQNPGQ